jgi:hypothetical protein
LLPHACCASLLILLKIRASTKTTKTTTTKTTTKTTTTTTTMLFSLFQEVHFYSCPHFNILLIIHGDSEE